MAGVSVLRPEPGASATVARLEAAGLRAVRVPLFALRPVAWQAPDAAAFDCLLLSSANAVRFAGPALSGLDRLPVLAVGDATAAAARDAGLRVAVTGTDGVAALGAWAAAMGFGRALHLAGRDRIEAVGIVAETRIVYAAQALEPPPGTLDRLQGTTALVHSPRAGAALARLTGDRRATIALAAISAAARDAAGPGWRAVAVAAHPTDAALVEVAGTLAIDPQPACADKTA